MNRFLSFKAILILLSFFMLTACGGGGGDSKPKPDPAPIVETDTDGDGIPDSSDTDDDNDGVADNDDAFPLDASESIDTDGDGIGNNADEDDDGDGVADSDDAFPLDAAESVDTDGDGIGNNADDDDDNDGVTDSDDAFPLDDSESVDTDGDGIGNNADEDDDGDGVNDDEDLFPLDPTETADNDNDGVGNNADFYPENAICYAETDGNGQDCYFTVFKQDAAESQLIRTDQNALLIFSPLQRKLLSYDASTAHFSEIVSTEGENEIVDAVYSESQQRTYYAYKDFNEVRYVDAQGEDHLFKTLDSNITRLMIQKNNLLVHDNYRLYRYSASGDDLGIFYFSGSIDYYAWDSSEDILYISSESYDQSRVYKLNFDFENNDLYVDYGENSETRSSPVILLENDLMLANERLRTQESLKLVSNGEVVISNYINSENSELITLKYDAGNTELSRWSSKHQIIERKMVDGAPIALLKAESHYIVITNAINSFQLTQYELLDDVDGDGIENNTDNFPNDVSASVDSDNDGYPDAWNDGYTETDSTSQLTLDAFPQDYVCWSAEHAATDSSCDFTATMTDYLPEITFADSNGVVYLYSNSNKVVHRWSSESEQYVAPAKVGMDYFDADINPFTIEASSNHGRLYLGYSTGEINFLPINTLSGAEQPFIKLSQSIEKMVNAGNFIVVKEGENYSQNRQIIDRNGAITSTETNSDRFEYSVWDQSSNHLYYRGGSESPRYIQIDQTSGTISDRGSLDYDYRHVYRGALRLSVNAQKLLVGSGTVYELDDYSVTQEYADIIDGFWLSEGEVNLLSQQQDAVTLRRLDALNRPLEQTSFSGSYINFVKAGEQPVIISQIDDQIVFNKYVVNNDSDGDGVANIEDAFPSDPAASIDSDNDGYPDEWNVGYTAENSTTGLTLDVFVNDSACWLASHDDGNGQCDFAASVPEFTPDLSFGDNAGVVYLLSREHDRLYRWSTVTQNYINPIVLGRVYGSEDRSPVTAYFSNAHQRVYISYESGILTHVPLGETTEHFFALRSQAASHLLDAGELIVVVEDQAFKLLNQQGEQLSVWNGYNPREVVWNAVNNRLFYLQDYDYSRYVQYLDIDLDTSTFTNSGSSNYIDGDGGITGPIKVVNDGQEVVLGTGTVLDVNRLQPSGQIEALTEIAWLENNELVQFNTSVSEDSFSLERRRDDRKLIEQRQFTGTLLDLVSTNEHQVLISQNDGQLSLEILNFSDDSDGDTVNNALDAFPLDSSASIDTDSDGYPDAWNVGAGEEDSTSELVLDAFINDSACWLSEHDNGSGECDYAATMPVFTPSAVAINTDDQVYLFDQDAGKIYRWSSALEAYLSPLNVNLTKWYGDFLPEHFTYSKQQQRVYLGYESGEITYLEQDTFDQNHTFVEFDYEIRGLGQAGNYLFALTNTNYSSEAKVLDSEGQVVSSAYHGSSSDFYAWDEINHRLYNYDYDDRGNVNYREISQDNGEMSSSFNSPYQLSFALSGAIRISNDGNSILFASGAILDKEGLNWQSAVDEFNAGDFLSSGDVVGLTANTGDFTLHRYASHTGQIVESVNYAGEPLAFLRGESVNVVVNQQESGFGFEFYEPNDDLDNDGVSNLEDAFPTDPAASVDSDRDGYPDAWNEGYSADDSTTGLALDAFDQDVGCWLATHSTEGGLCNYSVTIPAYIPDAFDISEFGMVYALSSDNNRIYRWNTRGTLGHWDPIVAQLATYNGLESPITLSVSNEHRRLYLGYATGDVTYIDLNALGISGNQEEVHFAKHQFAVTSLVPAGNYLVVHAGLTGHNNLVIYGSDASVKDTRSSFNMAKNPSWDAFGNHLYYLRDSNSPSYIRYLSINESTGNIDSNGNSNYLADNLISPISVAGVVGKVMLGSGEVYDIESREITATAENQYQFLSTTNIDFINVRENDGVWRLDLLNSDSFEVDYSEILENPVLGVLENLSATTIVHRNGNDVSYRTLNLYDSDGDRIPYWWEAKYGLSDEDASDAGLDNDGDQLTNLEEFFASTNPLMVDTDEDGLNDYAEINTHQTSPIVSDTDNDGLSDGDEVNVHGTEPLQLDTDSDGFSDGDEVNKYSTDPLDIDSRPIPLTTFSDSFEDDTLSSFWKLNTDSDAPWMRTDTDASEGSNSIRSGDIDDSQVSSLKFEGLLEAGVFSFDALVSAENCCDMLDIYINGNRVLTVNDTNAVWETHSVNVEFGENIIEFIYRKDGSATDGDDAAFIDNISYSSN
ncbi:hypothetical protein JQC92_07435 [Shewanella sp. 202IG2-18]|uniref:hypothetical protein n=1 Tax=Parashewanella hymeniacidonis TaxID=2807618 RepID=UPI0019616462|nr:hypothetical protein [Parashewanella hymeniacidonis]MBM7071873.1 hypothetical protein [Parashewanella hymeniacidonis]